MDVNEAGTAVPRRRVLRSRALAAAVVVAAGLAGIVLVLGLSTPRASGAPTCTITFTGEVDDNWDDSGNWVKASNSAHALPTSSDYACSDLDITVDNGSVRTVRGLSVSAILTIAAGSEVRIGTSVTAAAGTTWDASYVADLVLDGTRGGYAPLSITSSLTMGATGRIGSPLAATTTRGGSTLLAASATFDMDAGASFQGDHLFRNEGTINAYGGGLDLSEKARLENAGSWQLPDDASGGVVAHGAAGVNTFVNTSVGNLSRPFTGGDTTLSLPFRNDGFVIVEGGTLTLAATVAPTGPETGTWEIDGGAILSLAANRTFGPGSGLIGNGDLQVTAGSIDLGPITSLPSLILTGGTVSGSPTVTSTLTWSGGSFSGAGTTTIATTATVDDGGSSAGRSLLGGRTLVNQGVWTLGGSSVSLCNGSVLRNEGELIIDAAGAGFTDCGTGANVLRNAAAASLEHPNPGSSAIAVPFENHGNVTVDAGTLTVAGAPSATVDDGSHDVAAGATLALAGDRTFSGTATWTGDGTMSVTSGVIALGPITAVPQLQLTGGTVGGALDVAARLDWSGGTFAGAGSTTTVLNGATASIGAVANHGVAAGHTLRLQTPTSWTAGGLALCDGATLRNEAALDISGGGPVTTCGTGPNVVRNTATGTITKSGGPAIVINAGVQNDGTLAVAANQSMTVTGDLTNLTGSSLVGGTYAVADNGALQLVELTGSVTSSSASITLNGATSRLLNASGTNGLAALATNTGMLALLESRVLPLSGGFTNSGSVVIGNGAGVAVATGDYTQAAGSTVLAASTATVTVTDPARKLLVTGGSLSGRGTLKATTVQNGATVAPGPGVAAGPGVLTVTGAYTQLGTGTLAVDVAGTGPGTTHDRVTATGVATVGGTLAVTMGYTPTPGDAITLVSGSSRKGTFAATTGLPAAPALQVRYDQTAVVLDTGDLFHPLAPVRVQESRPDGPQVGPYGTPWGQQVSRTVQITGVAGAVPAGADAVALNVTVTGTTAPSYLTVWPTGDDRPLASSLDWAPGETIANAVTVKLGAGGKVSVFNWAGSVDVIFDVVGYYDKSGGDGFTSLTPLRIQESRPDGPQVGPYGTPWGQQTTRTVQVTGVGGAAGVPAGAEAVVLNVTVTGTTAPSYLTVWPTGVDKPLASSLDWAPNQTIANAVTVKLGVGGKISVFNFTGNVDVIVDVVGYFTPGSGDRFFPLPPARIQESRPDGPPVGPYTTPWGPQTARPFTVVGVGGVPASAAAVLLNITTTSATAPSYLTVWPTGANRPLASSIDWAPNQTIANAVTSKVGTGGSISAFNWAGTVDVIADVNGYYGH